MFLYVLGKSVAKHIHFGNKSIFPVRGGGEPPPPAYVTDEGLMSVSCETFVFLEMTKLREGGSSYRKLLK